MTRKFLIALALLPALMAAPAMAQQASYCNGQVVADSFSVGALTMMMPATTYNVMLRNTTAQPIQAVVNFTMEVIGLQDRAANRMVTLPPGQQFIVTLGTVPAVVNPPIPTPDVLSRQTRVTCG